MSQPAVPDQQVRDAALDPRHSFVIQAPAGSGKTELLIQRYLRLLSLVDEPEEVLAVTFTLKAAGEMRSRVIKALGQAEAGEAPQEPHLRRAYELAREVLGDERRRQWQLHRHPARLAIRTIDAVNAWIAGRTPMAGGGSSLQQIAASPEQLYREAARATIGLVVEDSAEGRAVGALLQHLDNDAGRVEGLLVDMLPRRDQWLRLAVDADAGRELLERALRRVTEAGLQEAARLLPAGFAGELLSLLPYAAAMQRDRGQPLLLEAWLGRGEFPGTTGDDLAAWRELAGALLTGDDQWRERLTVTNGFPPEGRAEKSRMRELLDGLAEHDALRLALAALRKLPGSHYPDAQWEILEELRTVLTLAAAQLRLACAARGETDFAEVAAAALDALGSPDEPSELGLLLDHRVQHLLVDEFQDTSLAQYRLLERLTAGWMPGDGRSFFLVGDPMQSIYRFREADVGIFMQVRDRGIGDIRPQFLQLRANFRSVPALVEWCNEAFDRTFPAGDDLVLGAVRFAPSIAARPDHPTAGVHCHWLPAGDEAAEAARVLELVQAARRSDPLQETCILVRSRSHAGPIIAALREAGVAFVAPDMDVLERSGVAQDLLALSRALCQPADRLAWIGVLRAPWCGLSLADLVALLGDDHDATVPDLLRDAGRVARLSSAGAGAVQRLLAVLEHVEQARERCGLRELVEGAWLALGGPATIAEKSQLESVGSFLDLLEAAEAAAGGLDLAWLTAQMPEHKGSLGGGGQGSLRIMTIHKAKGLEFDTVIVPGLHRQPRKEDRRLLIWQEVLMPDGGKLPMLAPIPAADEEGDPLYAYLKMLEQRRNELESDRLLYVACTRARRQLHLVAALELEGEDGDPKAPRSGSLLSRLWPALSGNAAGHVREAGWGASARKDRDPVWVQPLIRRLPPGWQLPDPPEELSLPAAGARAAAPAVVYEWAGRVAMHVGTVVHAFLQAIGETGPDGWTDERLQAGRPAMRRMLLALGVARHELDGATNRVVTALQRTLEDERGRWILEASHRGAASELALTVCEGERFRSLVIDRSFIDADGSRWVIDFKTSQHQGADLERFIHEEVERYRGQLRAYRDAVATMGGEPVRTALYFPLLGVFREVEWEPAPRGCQPGPG